MHRARGRGHGGQYRKTGQPLDSNASEALGDALAPKLDSHWVVSCEDNWTGTRQ